MRLIAVSDRLYRQLQQVYLDSVDSEDWVLNNLVFTLVNNCYVIEGPNHDKSHKLLVIMTYINTIYQMKTLYNDIDYSLARSLNQLYEKY